jgi:hypothetical protein
MDADAAAVAVAGVIGARAAGHLFIAIVAIIVSGTGCGCAAEITGAHRRRGLGENRGGGKTEKEAGSRESSHNLSPKEKGAAHEARRLAALLLVMTAAVTAAIIVVRSSAVTVTARAGAAGCERGRSAAAGRGGAGAHRGIS